MNGIILLIVRCILAGVFVSLGCSVWGKTVYMLPIYSHICCMCPGRKVAATESRNDWHLFWFLVLLFFIASDQTG